MSLKRGMFSVADKTFIDEKRHQWSIEDIARALKRRPQQVAAYLDANQAAQSNMTEEQMAVGRLHKKSFFRRLKAQLTNEELLYFQELWVESVKQFGGDLLPLEEAELKEFIMLEILKERLLAENKVATERRESAEGALLKLARLPEEQRSKEQRQELARLENTMMLAEALIKDNLRSFKDLAAKADRSRESLSASRQQRLKELDRARVDFVSFLKLLEEHEERLRVGREMEILRQVKDRHKMQLSKEHNFPSGEPDRILLSAETIDGVV